MTQEFEDQKIAAARSLTRSLLDAECFIPGIGTVIINEVDPTDAPRIGVSGYVYDGTDRGVTITLEVTDVEATP